MRRNTIPRLFYVCNTSNKSCRKYHHHVRYHNRTTIVQYLKRAILRFFLLRSLTDTERAAMNLFKIFMEGSSYLFLCRYQNDSTISICSFAPTSESRNYRQLRLVLLIYYVPTFTVFRRSPTHPLYIMINQCICCALNF